nr:venom protease-like [Leptinotarsa decemlineata]
MRLQMFLFGNICLLGLVNLVRGQISEGTPCFTSRNEYGLCTNIYDCEVILNLVKTRSQDPETRLYLQASTCLRTDKLVMVCCPQTANVKTIDDDRNSNGDNESTDAISRNNDVKEKKAQLLSKPDCGLSNVTNARVVGGTPAKLGEFPFIVALGYRNPSNPKVPKWLCGGTLISDRHILTAAHCVYNRKDLYLARLGELDLFSDDDGANPEDIRLIKAKVHENYSNVQFTNDIAILTLERKPTNRFREYTNLLLLYFSDGPSSSTLQLAEIPVVSQDHCKRAFGKQTVIDDRVLCAGWISGLKDACQGDSGGPLMFGMSEGRDLRYYQIGVVSYGFRCAEAGYPGVYTRVTNFIDWIQRNMD